MLEETSGNSGIEWTDVLEVLQKFQTFPEAMKWCLAEGMRRGERTGNAWEIDEFWRAVCAELAPATVELKTVKTWPRGAKPGSNRFNAIKVVLFGARETPASGPFGKLWDDASKPRGRSKPSPTLAGVQIASPGGNTTTAPVWPGPETINLTREIPPSKRLLFSISINRPSQAKSPENFDLIVSILPSLDDINVDGLNYKLGLKAFEIDEKLVACQVVRGSSAILKEYGIIYRAGGWSVKATARDAGIMADERLETEALARIEALDLNRDVVSVNLRARCKRDTDLDVVFTATPPDPSGLLKAIAKRYAQKSEREPNGDVFLGEATLTWRRRP